MRGGGADKVLQASQNHLAYIYIGLDIHTSTWFLQHSLYVCSKKNTDDHPLPVVFGVINAGEQYHFDKSLLCFVYLTS